MGLSTRCYKYKPEIAPLLFLGGIFIILFSTELYIISVLTNIAASPENKLRLLFLVRWPVTTIMALIASKCMSLDFSHVGLDCLNDEERDERRGPMKAVHSIRIWKRCSFPTIPLRGENEVGSVMCNRSDHGKWVCSGGKWLFT